MNQKSFNADKLKEYFLPVAVLVVVVLIIPFAFLPQVNRIRFQAEELGKGKERLKLLEDKDNALLAMSLEELLATRSAVLTALPQSQDLARLIVGIGRIAALSEVNIKSMDFVPGKVATKSAKEATSSVKQNTDSQPSKPQESKEKGELEFNVSVIGNISGLQRFLGLVEEAKRIFLVKDFSATSEETGLNITFKLNAPYRELPKLSDINDPLPTFSTKEEELFSKLDRLFIDYTNIIIPPGKVGKDNLFR